jgi:hypothetical protein
MLGLTSNTMYFFLAGKIFNRSTFYYGTNSLGADSVVTAVNCRGTWSIIFQRLGNSIAEAGILRQWDRPRRN